MNCYSSKSDNARPGSTLILNHDRLAGIRGRGSEVLGGSLDIPGVMEALGITTAPSSSCPSYIDIIIFSLLPFLPAIGKKNIFSKLSVDFKI